MRELLVVLNTRAQGFLKRAFEWKWQAVAKNLSSILVFGGFAFAVFLIARYATSYLIFQAHIGQYLFHRFLSMLLYVFFLTVNLGNMIVSFSTLYRSHEVNFLMALPISAAKIFLIKFVDNFFYSSSTLSLLGFAMLLGYGSVFDLPWYYYFFTMFFLFLPFMLIAGILAVTALMLLIKIAGRLGFRTLLFLLVIAYLSVVYFYFTMTNPVQLVHEVMKHYPDVNEYFGYLDPPFVKFLPNHWVAEFLYWSVQGDYGRAVPFFFLLFLTMMGLVVLAGLIARRFYYESWLEVADAQTKKGSEASPRFMLMKFGKPTGLAPDLEVLIKRDLWLFLREPSQWLHLTLMFLLLLMFLVSVGTLDLRLTQPFLQSVSFLIVFLFNGFLIASISLRFVFPSISLEGDPIWCVRTAPLSLKRLYWYKVLLSLIVVLCVAECISITSIYMLQKNVLLVIVAATATLLVAIALISMNIGAGGYFAMYREKNPIRVASSQGASLTFLASMIYLTVVTAVLIVPLTRYFETQIRGGNSSVDWVYVPLGTIAVLSMLMFVLSTSIGLRAIHRDL
ncbi:MAG: hypothetical protein HY708_06415 [Ignavibacteriae bacterium]|nr:hypothetical protein [Ignavibacteriota bacterium]